MKTNNIEMVKKWASRFERIYNYRFGKNWRKAGKILDRIYTRLYELEEEENSREYTSKLNYGGMI